TPIPDDRLALPSPTPLPTATPPPAPTATSAPAIAAATVAPQAVPTANTVDLVPAVAAVAQQDPAGAPPPVAAAPGMATLRVIAEGDVQISIIADDVTVFSGWLGAEGSTEWFSAAEFAVTTSDGNLTLFENQATGQQFYMGYGQNETYYLGG
ncbi:MAG: hypothetical protein M3Q50_15875, partial [Chloroflexota bacterium]|nr:hypothetical protein [Chloroflexota bacterium]